MKYIHGEDYRTKIERVRRMVEGAVRRRNGFALTPLTEEARARVEDVTRFEQFKGRVLKQNGSEMRVTNR